MSKFVIPKTYLIGCTRLDYDGLRSYLKDTGNESFEQDIFEARTDQARPLSDLEILSSFYAKTCYKSLSEGKNANLGKTRSIHGNLRATRAAAHGSVFEHAMLNFIVTDCSRVFTHELVRHRVGTAFSQTSGRYVRGDTIGFVLDPILKPVEGVGHTLLGEIEREYAVMCDAMGLNGLAGYRRYLLACAECPQTDDTIREIAKERLGIDLDKLSFDYKKKVTSALRRFLPNGQSNEIGFSLNLRTLRHTIMVRTSRHAEWEIRVVFNQIYRIVKERFPLMFEDAKEEEVESLLEIAGMRLQPYEQQTA